MRKSIGFLTISAVLVSACSSGGAPRSVSASPTSPAGTFRAPVVQSERGLEGVIGQEASALTRRFGDARLDLSEGDARKLQYSSNECVLDIFLYPLRDNERPVATHIEARQRVGGAATNRAQCIEHVERTVSGS